MVGLPGRPERRHGDRHRGAADFPVSTAYEDHTIVLCVTGEFDLQGQPDFASRLTALQDGDSDGVERLCMDLREITFIDSSGLHAIVNPRAGPKTRASSSPSVRYRRRPGVSSPSPDSVTCCLPTSSRRGEFPARSVTAGSTAEPMRFRIGPGHGRGERLGCYGSVNRRPVDLAESSAQRCRRSS